mgnify:CR=1 FL=1
MNKLIMFLPSVNNGGNEKNFFSTANNLHKNNVKISVISCSKKKVKSKIIFKNNFNLFDLDFLNLKLKYIICFFVLLFKNKKKNPILSFQGNIISIIAAKIIGCEVFIRFNSYPDNFIKNSFKKEFLSFFYKKADGIIVNSNEIKNILKKKFNLESILIRNEIDIKKIKKLSKEKVKFDFFKNKKNKTFIILGRLDKNKNHQFIIKALNKIKGKYKFNLLIIGSGYMKTFLINLINKYNLNEIIKIIDFRKNPYPYILRADGLILSSFYEGYPNVLLEAGVLNKIIISSNCKSGPKEIIGKSINGYLFKSNNFESFKKSLIKNKNNQSNLSKVKSFKKFIKKFHGNDHSGKYKKLIFKNS